jgi:membrane fusion protein, multidrug efflux system
MAFKIKGSHIIAFAITVGIAGWMAAGEIVIGGQNSDGTAAAPIAEREASRTTAKFKVRYVPLQQEQREEQLVVRGRTEADAIVPIRAETGGILKTRHVNKGDRVEKGELVCEIEAGSRQANVAQAEAQLIRAQSEYESNTKLNERGFSSRATLNEMKAALEAARAVLAEAKLELARTKVHANASGIAQDPLTEPGDMLSAGGTCVTLIDTDPMLFIGQISERNISRIETGMQAGVELVGGSSITGTVSYIAPSADPQTRTFRTEIRMANPDNTIRDGLTATARIDMAPITAFRISPSWITLADNGEVGLRIVNDENRVEFVPVEIIAQTIEGFWISGPEAGMKVITLGQEYVIPGEEVEPVADPVVAARFEKQDPRQSGEITQ